LDPRHLRFAPRHQWRLSENIRVKFHRLGAFSGTFSRIVCFGNGHGLPHKKVGRFSYSSADLDGAQPDPPCRNTGRDENPTVKAQITSQVRRPNLAGCGPKGWVSMSPDWKFFTPEILPTATFAVSTATASSWKTPPSRGAARRGRPTFRN